jgi:hypothetical protein
MTNLTSMISLARRLNPPTCLRNMMLKVFSGPRILFSRLTRMPARVPMAHQKVQVCTLEASLLHPCHGMPCHVGIRQWTVSPFSDDQRSRSSKLKA